MGSENNEFSITIPPFFCPFPCRMHPDVTQMIEMSDAWMVDCCKRITAAHKSELAAKLFSADQFVNSSFGLVTALFFANAVSTQRVLPILKFMPWYFLLDNCVDEPGMFGSNNHDHATQVIIESVMAVFKSTNNDTEAPLGKPTPFLSLTSHDHLPITCGEGCIEDVPQHASKHDSDDISSHTLVYHTPLDHVSEPALQKNIACDKSITDNSSQAYIIEELAHILTSTTAEWWSDMCIDMPLSQQARFIETIRGYLNCILKETPFRSTYHLPDTHTYLHIRTHTIGWYPLALLTEYTLCMELDQEAITNPLVVALQQSVCDSLILVNDITSFRKEYESGDKFNIIMVLCFNKLKGKSEALPKYWANLATQELLQESMNEACEMLREKNQGCVSMIENIKGSPVLMKKPGMGVFLEAMGNIVAGNIYWHLTSGRYTVFASGSNDNKSPKEVIKGVNILASHTLHLKRVSGHVTH